MSTQQAFTEGYGALEWIRNYSDAALGGILLAHWYLSIKTAEPVPHRDLQMQVEGISGSHGVLSAMMVLVDQQTGIDLLMEQITPHLRKNWRLHTNWIGEPLRRMLVGGHRMGRDPFDVLWELRESGLFELLGGDLPDDKLPMMSRLSRGTVWNSNSLYEAEACAKNVLVGGGAVLLHGHSRHDRRSGHNLVEANEENARRLLAALATWGSGAGTELMRGRTFRG